MSLNTIGDQSVKSGADEHWIGIHLPESDDPVEAIKDGYNFMTAPVLALQLQETLLDGRPKSREEVDQLLHRHTLPRSHGPDLVAFASPWLELDAKDPYLATISCQVLKYEVSYVSFCGISSIIIPCPTSRTRITKYANNLSTILRSTSSFCQICVSLPLCEENVTLEGEDFSILDIWHTIEQICAYDTRLFIAMQVPPKLPSELIQSRFFSCPVKIIIISGNIYIENAKGWPVLSKGHQSLLHKFLKLKVCTLLQDTQTSGMKGGKPAFLAYLRHLYGLLPPPSEYEKATLGYQDYLQIPLQPLSNNLENATYEVFEKDQIKYKLYAKAIELAFMDRTEKEKVIVAVLGAGRGPLVEQALKAAKSTGRDIELWAVEKNPNAYVGLLWRNKAEWLNKVNVVHSDMREWNPTRKMDIIISELLGSFGDNELSPECLDGAQRFLNPTNGVSIPSSYTAHISPIMSHKLHSAILALKDAKALETPYVVMFQAYSILADQDRDEIIKPLWEFKHPTIQTPTAQSRYNAHNKRHATVTFKVQGGTCHGLAGYFEAVLYKGIELSIRPDRVGQKCPNMTSWFPLYFPLKTPVYIPAGNIELDAHIWRQTDGKRVWYEWCVETFLVVALARPSEREALFTRAKLGITPLHNSLGEASSMAM